MFCLTCNCTTNPRNNLGNSRHSHASENGCKKSSFVRFSIRLNDSFQQSYCLCPDLRDFLQVLAKLSYAFQCLFFDIATLKTMVQFFMSLK